MTTNHIKAILTSLRAMVVKMLPAYKFYLGSTTETTTTQIGHGVMSVKDGQTQGQGALTLDDASFSGFVEGETYTAVINGVSGEYVAVQSGDDIVITNIQDFGNMPEDYWAVGFISPGTGTPYILMYMVSGSYANATISVSQTKTVTTKKYQTKKLDNSLLPDSVESGIKAANAKATDAMSTANAAQSTASAAQATANTAKSTADTAKTTAETAQTKAETARTTADNCVKYSGSQALTDAQKKQARDNIGAGTSSFNGSYDSLSGKPTLSKVATGGSYNDLDDRPCYEDRTYSQLFSPLPRPSILSGSVYIGKKTTGYPSIDEGVLYATKRGGEYTDPCICKNISFSTSTGLENKYIGNLALYADVDESDRFSTDTDAYIGDLTSYDTGENWLYIVKQTTSWSMFVAAVEEDQFGVYLYKVTENVKQLSNALIPDTIQRVGEAVILKSSTSGSTKKFKLTVNDTGTLSATEVTDA